MWDNFLGIEQLAVEPYNLLWSGSPQAEAQILCVEAFWEAAMQEGRA